MTKLTKVVTVISANLCFVEKLCGKGFLEKYFATDHQKHLSLISHPSRLGDPGLFCVSLLVLYTHSAFVPLDFRNAL
jgi:hypothetical protein